MLFRSVLLSAVFWGLFAAGLRFTVVPPESCGAHTKQAIGRAAGLAADWMARNQLEDGRYVYLYYPETDSIPGDYNEVRHAGVTMALYQAAGKLSSREATEAADRALAWMIDNLERHDGWAALAPDGKRGKLGASALMLVSLAERRLALHDPQYDDLMLDLAGFIRTLQRPDGGFHVAWDFEKGAPDTYGTSAYYPGEATWALALTHEAFPGAGLEDSARRALAFITERRDEVEDIEFPPLADQWAAYSIGEMVEWGLTDQQVSYAERLAARFSLLVRTEAQREGSWYGRMLRDRTARASGVGTWAEGLAALWRASTQDPRLEGVRAGIEDRLECVAGILAERQISPQEAHAYPRPGLAEGAWFTRGETRMDDQQHAFSGLVYALDMLNGHPTREPVLPFPRPLQ